MFDAWLAGQVLLDSCAIEVVTAANNNFPKNKEISVIWYKLVQITEHPDLKRFG